jgi:hypothetical protein
MTGERVETPQGMGVVVGWHGPLAIVSLDAGGYVEVAAPGERPFGIIGAGSDGPEPNTLRAGARTSAITRVRASSRSIEVMAR